MYDSFLFNKAVQYSMLHNRKSVAWHQALFVTMAPWMCIKRTLQLARDIGMPAGVMELDGAITATQ